MTRNAAGSANLRILLIAGVAALAGAGASLFFDPTLATRLASTEPGQRVLGAVLDARAPDVPVGVIVAKRGDIVPTMTLADSTGTKVTFPGSWVGRPTLINLWATWCAPCLKEMPELQAFVGEQGSTGVRVVGIALDDAAAVNEFLHAHAINYPSLVDAPGTADAGVRLGNPAGVLPYTVLIDAKGRLQKTRIGPFESGKEITEWATTD
ncbi:MAG: TlpA disulfide reductase family protein [Thermomonas sp.]